MAIRHQPTDALNCIAILAQRYQVKSAFGGSAVSMVPKTSHKPFFL